MSRLLQAASFRFLFVCFALFLLSSCGSQSAKDSRVIRIGIDPDWYPVNFGPQGSYVNGFVEELLLDISKSTGIPFERIEANWDSLYDGLKRKQYDAVFSSLPQYNFTLAEYDFSPNFLNLGPVLIVPLASSLSSLDQATGARIGIINGDVAISVLSEYPNVLIRDSYTSIPDLLAAVASGEIQGALLEAVPAVSYVTDLFSGVLRIATPPLNDAGLHLVALKGEQSRFVKQFSQSIEAMQKNKSLQTLLQKWRLAS